MAFVLLNHMHSTKKVEEKDRNTINSKCTSEEMRCNHAAEGLSHKSKYASDKYNKTVWNTTGLCVFPDEVDKHHQMFSLVQYIS